MLNTPSANTQMLGLDLLAEKRDRGEGVEASEIIEAFKDAAQQGHQIHRPSAVARLLDRRLFSLEELVILRNLALEAAHRSYELIGNGLYRQIQNPQHFVQTLLYHELAAKADRLKKSAS